MQPGDEMLAPFQQRAAERLRSILLRWKGALLADSVGLGKTHVAATLVRERLAAGAPVVVCGPASLRVHWKRKLGRTRDWQWLSHTSLSRGMQPHCAGGLLVIDEAHALRNPATRRYRAAATMAEHADVLLLTATPVNNSVFDFLHLVRLFATDDAFARIGVPSLRAAAERAAAGGYAEPLCRVAETVVVRRTRTQAAAELVAPGAPPLSFPRQQPLRSVQYDLRECYSDLEVLLDGIMHLTFPVHAHIGAHSRVPPSKLMRLALLKRLESSPAALAASLGRYAALLAHAADAAHEGYILDEAARQSARSAQLVLKSVALHRWPSRHDRARFAADVGAEQARVLAAQQVLRAARADVDPKFAALCRLLDNDVAEESVLLFTEFRDTATELWRALARRGGVALIHGADARLGLHRSSRRAIIERFAPVSNGVPPPPARERVRLLIATDVLAEGLNLQDARIVVSYDLPWNPVRLAQRIGRIDRLGSPHASVSAFAFVPAREVESLLGLMRRLRRKLRAIRTIGGDAPRLRAAAVTGRLERAEQLRTAWRRYAATCCSPQSDEVLCARLEWSGRVRRVLVAIDGGGPPHLLLWPPARRRVRTPLPDTDDLLMRALQLERATDVDTVVVRRAIGWALATLRLSLHAAHPHTAAAPISRAARLVRRWARRNDADPAAADRVLHFLAAPAASQMRIRQALAASDDTARVQALMALAAESPASAGDAAPALVGRGTGEGRTPRVRVLAALELVPPRRILPGNRCATAG
jgi:hypothetical protein